MPQKPQYGINLFYSRGTFLGVTIDDKLNFSEHINITCKKASQRIGVLMRSKNLVPTAAKLQLFNFLSLPRENSNVFSRGVCAQSLGMVNPHMRSC